MGLFTNVKRLPRPLTWGLALFLRAYMCTLKVEWRGREHLGPEDPAEREPMVLAIWHNRLLCMPALGTRQERERYVFLASRSRDGGYISDFLREFGMRGVRGSSSKGAVRAVLEMQDELEAGFSVVLTPDGPRGPRYAVKEGSVWLASASGKAIVPVLVNSPRHWELGGWDRFQIPKPFSRLVVVIGEPLAVPPNLDQAGRKEWASALQGRMLALTEHDDEPVAIPEAGADASKGVT